MSNFDTLLFKVENSIATITLNRPEDANGMNIQLGQDLYAASRIVFYDDSIRVVVINANGKLFSGGGDLKFMEQHIDNLGPTVKLLADELHRAINLLAHMEKPLIVGVHAMAAGAGMSLAMIGDFVIAGESAKFTMAYTAAGLSPDGSSSFFLPRLIGIRRTTELMLTNRRLSAEEALDWGLISQVVPDDELKETVAQLANKLAKGPTKAFGFVKKLMLCTFENSLETQMELEGRGIAANAASTHGTEGIKAFLSKRKPEFK